MIAATTANSIDQVFARRRIIGQLDATSQCSNRALRKALPDNLAAIESDEECLC